MMDLGLFGKRALVTGSSAGIGRAIAEMLAAEGVSVIVHGRDEARTNAVAATIGAGAIAVIGDLSTSSGAAAVAEASGDIDILVNNAGGYDDLGWSTLTPEQWLRSYDVNVVSGVRMIEHFVPGMRRRGWGRVIQIGGGLAIQPVAGLPHYSATLAARHNLTVSLARELGGTGVTANIVAPGVILTDSAQEMTLDISADHGTFANDVGRWGRPEEIAAAVAFLASEHAAYISGADLRVDGGTIRSVA